MTIIIFAIVASIGVTGFLAAEWFQPFMVSIGAEPNWPTWLFVMTWAVFWIGYFLPTFIANARGHRNALAIFGTNLLLGWSFMFWVVALVWSLLATDNKADAFAVDHREYGSPVRGGQLSRLVLVLYVFIVGGFAVLATIYAFSGDESSVASSSAATAKASKAAFDLAPGERIEPIPQAKFDQPKTKIEINKNDTRRVKAEQDAAFDKDKLPTAIANLSGYDSETRRTMELACTLQRGEGPVAYGACLNRQIASLQRSLGIPILIGHDGETRQTTTPASEHFHFE
jgi:hypothetical protein